MKASISSPKSMELLAPVGRFKGLEPILESGADAVYLAGKDYNMRRHRSDFNFDRDQIAQTAVKVHDAGAKLYVAVNSLLSDQELEGVGDYLRFLQSVGADAIIVQDLGLIRLVKEREIHLPLHASTMMNIHSAEGAIAAAGLGIGRIICSRDITLAQVEEMGRKSGLEMEYFVHGDMCFVQSGQCYASGLIFGNSSNRGKCMKPCRWPYELIDLADGSRLPARMEGNYLLAVKDMCLLQRIPELVQAGIVSLKIEGRMRPPEFMSQIVNIYRRAIDRYHTDPLGYSDNFDLFEELYRERVREFSTSVAFRRPGAEFIGSTGEREPLFLSTGAVLPEIDLLDDPEGFPTAPRALQSPRPELAVHVATPQAAARALAGGADWIYVGGEVPSRHDHGWNQAALECIIRDTRASGKKVGLLTPRVTVAHQLQGLARLLDGRLAEPPDAVLVHNLGSLQLLKATTDIPIHADFSLNVINVKALELLHSLGAARATVSLEAAFDTVAALAAAPPMPLECLVHGPLPGMYAEHCLISLALRGTSADEPCRGTCRHLRCGLKNRYADIFPVETDQYCRSHILLSKDLACLRVIGAFFHPGIKSLRIEGQYYDPSLVGYLTELYARTIQTPDEPIGEKALQRLVSQSPRGFSLGAYPKGIFAERAEDYKTVKKDMK
ncbi:MAG: peptidase U32 family protein [Thermodesulfobacteriota bacterium]